MKKFTKLMLLPALLLGATACSSELDEPNNGVNDGSKVYMTFDVQNLTEGTRSSTQDDGTVSTDKEEIGKDYENKISTMVVVLVGEDGKVISMSDATNKLTHAGNNYTGTAGFNATDFQLYSSTTPVNAHAYVFCNISRDDISAVVGEDFNLNQTLKGTAWTSNNFWMTNADTKVGAANANISIPAAADLKAATDPEKAESVNREGEAIKVERTCARFDYKAVNAGNAYYIKNKVYNDETNEWGTTDENMYKITLTDMAIMNSANTAYALRRVSADGTSTDWSIGGRELSNNYVVAWDWEAKKTNRAAFDYGKVGETYAYANRFNTKNALPSSWISLGTNQGDDNHTGGWDTPENTEHAGYKIMAYTMPNTLPGIESQYKNVTTGIVFKAEITAEDAAPDFIKTAMTAHKQIVIYNNTVIGAKDALEAMVAEAGTYGKSTDLFSQEICASYKAYVEAKNALDESDPNYIEDERRAFSQQGFKTVIPNAAGKYIVYYYYWNRHNDNGDNNIMGPMEFAVVRNNVYKLAVTSINWFGHTGTPGNDPDPEDPNDPDEDGKVYMKVEVAVLPWVVRINNIEF